MALLTYFYFKAQNNFLKMQELTKREQISLFMMRRWGDCQKSYKEVDPFFNEIFQRGSAFLNLQWSVL